MVEARRYPHRTPTWSATVGMSVEPWRVNPALRWPKPRGFNRLPSGRVLSSASPKSARSRRKRPVPPRAILLESNVHDLGGSRLVIVDEILRRVRAPDIKRIFRRVVAAIPVAVGGDEVDIR